MTFTVVDWICGIIILIFAIAGIIKGFVNNVMGKLALALGILMACMFYKTAGINLLASVENITFRNILGFLIVFVVVFLIVKCIQVIISRVFEWEVLKSLDRTLGFVFGAVEGLAVIGLLMFLLSIQPFFDVSGIFKDSFFYSLLNIILSGKSKEIMSNV